MYSRIKKYYVIIYIIIIYFISIPIVFNYEISLCGPSSLLIICEKMGVSTTLEELCSLTCFDKQKGTTFLGLYRAAIKKGLPVVPVKINMEQLCKIKGSSIVFVGGNHFLVVHGCERDKIIIQSPPGNNISIFKKVFEKQWQGEALVFSEKLKKQMASKIAEKTAPLKGPHIYFCKTDYTFGTVNEGEKLSYTFTFTNIGTETLNIYARSTCGCTAAVLSDKRIPPGDSGEIKITLDTSGRKGPTKHGAYVRTNDPDNQMIKLTISATVRSAVKAVPERIWLDEVVKNQEIKREILVIDPGDSTLQVESVKTPEGIIAKIFNVRTENIRAVPIQLTINTGKKPGEFEKTITIQTNDEIRPEIPVTISGIVLAEVKAFPPAIFYGEVKSGTKIVREITLLSTNGDRLEIIKAASALPCVKTKIITIEDGSKYKLVAVLQTPTNSTTLRDNIPIYIKGKDQPVLEIPLYARVVSNIK